MSASVSQLPARDRPISEQFRMAVFTSMHARAQGTDDLDDLNGQVGALYGQGKYAEATSVAKLSLALAEKKFGPDHLDVGAALNNLAELYRRLGRYAVAEPLMRRALTIAETALGPDHPIVATAHNNLAALYDSQGRYAEAEPLMRRALAIVEKTLSADDPTLGSQLNNLAMLYLNQGRYAEA